jgi:hypothetical protein
MRTADRVTQLFELLAAAPDGLTKPQIAYLMTLSIDRVEQVVHDLRIELGGGDTVTVPCDPDPDNPGGPWIYKLVGNITDAKEYFGYRVRGLEAEMVTMYAMTESLLRSADKRTRDGRQLGAIHRHLGRMLEDLEEINHPL